MHGRLFLSALLVFAAASSVRAQTQHPRPPNPQPRSATGAAAPGSSGGTKSRVDDGDPCVAPALNSASRHAEAPRRRPRLQKRPRHAAKLEEQVEVQEQRTAQLDQEKISTEHKLPLTLTGMLLANTFWTGKGAGGGSDNPTIAPPASGPVDAGGTFRQSVIGVKFDGLDIVGGGKITGSAYGDFYRRHRRHSEPIDAAARGFGERHLEEHHRHAGVGQTDYCASRAGLAGASRGLAIDLGRKSVAVAAPDPGGAAFHFGDQAGLRAQAGMYETSEGGTGLSTSEYASSLAKSRPGYEGRFEFWKASGENRTHWKSPPDFTSALRR